MRKFAAIILVFSLIGCEQKYIEVNHQTAILGKWKIVELGNEGNLHPISQPTVYEEYKADSILLVHEYSTEKVISERYYWKSDTLFKGGGFGYKCQFYDNKMRMDRVVGTAIFYTSIYERAN